MKIFLTLLCRNEADIIRHIIEFHLSHGVDFIIVTDNASEDDTPKIVQDYVRCGRVELIHEPRLTHDQSIWVSAMARRAALRGADWVINADADEFWWSAGCNLRTSLSAVPSSVFALTVQRHNFAPVRCEPSDFADRMIYRDSLSLNSFGAPLPPKVVHRADAEVTVEDGNHAVWSSGRKIEAPPTEAIEILHFPVRGFEQFRRKIILGTEALERNSRIHPDVGATWRHHYYQHYKKALLLDYYRAIELTEDKIEQRIRDGSLIPDTRLRDFVALARVSA